MLLQQSQRKYSEVFSVLRTSFLSVPQLKLCTHVCLRSSYFSKGSELFRAQAVICPDKN